MDTDMAVTHDARTLRLLEPTDEFVGRTTELRQIDELLHHARLLTLTGPGGVGKTRLALRAAASTARQHADGEFFVDLAALRDPELVAHTVSRALGLPQAAGSQRDALLTHLRDSCLLLILDTCEHLIDACAQLAEDILAQAPLVTLLATSREPLSVAGETIFQLGPLLVSGPAGGEEAPPFGTGGPGRLDGPGEPGRGGQAEADDGAGDAVELFARRAATAAPGFTVTAANRADVIRICRAVDGIPLAIEMAAGRLSDLTLTAITGQLDRRLALLTGGPGGRHATARNVLAWSFETCNAAERVLWARLSVFPAQFSAAAAAEVCASGELSGPAILETIIALVNKSLLARVDPADNSQPVFRMLDLVREFGADRLTASGEEPGIRDRLLARCLAMARQAGELESGDSQVELFAALRSEHPNIRAALSRALESRAGPASRDRDGAELASRLWAYWISSGLIAEATYWLGKALDLVTEPVPQRAWLLVARCIIGVAHASGAPAVDDGRNAVELARKLQRPEIEGRGYACLCLAYMFSHDLDAASEAGEQAARLLAQAGDTDGLIILDAHLAVLCYNTAHLEQGISYCERGIRRFRADSSERFYHSYLHLSAAFCYLGLPGRDADCARALSLALMAQYDLDEVTGTAFGLEMLGWLAAAAGRGERAAWLLGAADPQWNRLGLRLNGVDSLEQRHDDAAAAARDQLGPARFAAVFAAGRRHPLSQLVALAVNDADTLDGPQPAADRPGPGALTDRELEVAYLAAAGLSDEQVAGQLFLPPEAVRQHRSSVFGKLGVTSAAQLGPWLGDQVPR